MDCKGISWATGVQGAAASRSQARLRRFSARGYSLAEVLPEAQVEGQAHRRLKDLGLRWLRDSGAKAVAAEVRCPIARYRVDVAGWIDAPPKRGSGGGASGTARTVVIECKSARADFQRNGTTERQLEQTRIGLERVARAMERDRIEPEEPHLRRSGTALFSELETWDYARSRNAAYRDVRRRLHRVDADLYGSAKFALIARYRLADELYIAAPHALVRHCEVPPGWGLLECPPSWLDDEAEHDRLDEPPTFTVAIPAEPRDASERHRVRMLRNIAVAASSRAYARR
ncbi:MAG: hypothetical protein ACYTGR_01795 [Planctomycetota bacterium]|jgi:hypothetical protein